MLLFMGKKNSKTSSLHISSEIPTSFAVLISQSPLNLIVRLLLGHLLGAFTLQGTKIVSFFEQVF